MNTERLANKAAELEKLLIDCAQRDDEAAKLLSDLGSLLVAAKEMHILAPMEWRDIPGAYFFTEGTLRKYRDIERAFAEFRLELTGGDNPVLG